MVNIVQKLAENPLRKPDPRSPEEDEKEKKAHMKTKMLDITVFKIATLL